MLPTSRPLPIQLDDLLAIESVRLELKKTFDDQTLDSAMRTICAFANDFLEVNGGYLIFGVESDADTGSPILPPVGLRAINLDEAQKTLFEKCKQYIKPDYIPIVAVDHYQKHDLLIVWCPPGSYRPYQVPKQISQKGSPSQYYIRDGSVTSEAKGRILTELMQKANQTPFDDRANPMYTTDVISPTLVRNFLSDLGSDWVTPGMKVTDQHLYRSLRLSKPINGYDALVNVSLLMFVEDPEKYLPGTRIEIVEFDDEGDTIKTHVFRGPLHTQVRQVLNHLEGFNATTIQKVNGQAETHHTVAFPYTAMREAVVNAVCHRSYESNPNPILIRLYPDKMEIISYPGPLPGIRLEDFRPDTSIVPQHRNRRVSDFFKQLKLAETYGTGIRKIYRQMLENGSPQPKFEFDEARSYFRVTLPAHPQYVVTNALRRSAEYWAKGERKKAVQNLEATLQVMPKSGLLHAQHLRYLVEQGDMLIAEARFDKIAKDTEMTDRALVYTTMIKAYLDQQNQQRAEKLLSEIPYPDQSDETLLDLAILYKRARRYEDAHRIFSDAYDSFKQDPKAIHEYAQTKMALAGRAKDETRTKLNREAESLLRRAIQMAGDNIRKAWCYFNLAEVLCWLQAPFTEVVEACQTAVRLHPNESHFQKWFEHYQETKRCKIL